MAIAGTSAAAAEEPVLAMPGADRPFPWIAAHRGQWRSAPENSLPAIDAAIDQGAEIVEIDIRKTRDGGLVLMHDETVDRTTNGTGRVVDLTTDEVSGLRLREKLGSGPASLTDEKVPSFEEVLDLVEGRNVLLNLDKAWPIREDLYDALAARDMVEYGLFKGAPTAAEATAFMDAHPDARYMHIVNDANAGDLELFPTAQTPVAFEIVYDSHDDPQAQPAYWDRVNEISQVWVNTMWSSLAAGETDEASLRAAAEGWQAVVDRGAELIQTDNVETLDAWRSGTDVTRLGMTRTSVRAQAEDYVSDPAAYSDTDSNTCTDPVADPASPVDACDLDGAHVVQYIRDGEWFTLRADAPRPGRYRLTMRHSSDTAPGGTVQIDTGSGWSDPISLPNTTHDRNFEIADLGRHPLKAGKNDIRLRFSHPDDQSVDWLQLDRR